MSWLVAIMAYLPNTCSYLNAPYALRNGFWGPLNQLNIQTMVYNRQRSIRISMVKKKEGPFDSILSFFDGIVAVDDEDEELLMSKDFEEVGTGEEEFDEINEDENFENIDDYDDGDDEYDRSAYSDGDRIRNGGQGGDGYDDNPVTSAIGQIYDAVFFYGLDTPEVKNRKRLSNVGYSAFQRRKRKRLPNNPFFTASEQLGLYLLDAGDFEDEVGQFNRRGTDDMTRPSRGTVSQRNKWSEAGAGASRNAGPRRASNEGSGDKDKGQGTRTIPYDINDPQSLQRYIASIQRYIAKLEREIRVLNITIASVMDDAVEDSVEESLAQEMEEKSSKLENAKVELITILAILEDFKSSNY